VRVRQVLDLALGREPAVPVLAADHLAGQEAAEAAMTLLVVLALVGLSVFWLGVGVVVGKRVAGWVREPYDTGARVETAGLPDGVVPPSVSDTPPADDLVTFGKIWLSEGVELTDFLRRRYGLGEQDADSRFAAIEARLRAYGMHDPDCPTFRTEQDQRRTGAYLIPKPCDCWLSRPDGGAL
jgi:hypothetical protein